MSHPTSDQAEITDLLARYCAHLDRDEHEEWVALFTPDAVYAVYGRTFEGHDGLRRMAASAPGGLHLGGLPVIEIQGGTARTRQSLLFVDRVTGEQRAAVYDDELVRTPTGWRFARRTCRFLTPDGLSDRPPSGR